MILFVPKQNYYLILSTGAAIGVGSLVMTFFTLTMGFLIPASEIPPWYIWIYWINPLRYILQGLVVNEVGGDGSFGDELIGQVNWTYNDRWWYCYVAVLLFCFAICAGILPASKISWLKR